MCAGNVEPGTYGLVLKHLRLSHPEQPSLTWEQMVQSLRCPAQPAAVVKEGNVRIQRGGTGAFEPCVLRLTSDEVQLVVASASVAEAGHWQSTGSAYGLSTGAPKNAREGQTHCLRVDLCALDTKQFQKFIVAFDTVVEREAWAAAFGRLPGRVLHRARKGRPLEEGAGRLLSAREEIAPIRGPRLQHTS